MKSGIREMERRAKTQLRRNKKHWIIRLLLSYCVAL